MKIPKTFIKEGKEIEQDIEDIIKNTLVDKVLVKDLAKEIKEYFDNENMAEVIQVSFEKKFDVSSDPDLNTQLEKHPYGEYYLKEEVKNSLQKLATSKVLDKIRELYPDIKEEEITHTYTNTFNIITKDVAYKFFLHIAQPYNDRKKVIKTIKKNGLFGEKTKQIEETYYLIRIKGDVNYAKFDKTHNEALLKILKDEGYLVSVEVIRQKEKDS